MNKILKEILEDNPELEKDKEKLEKIIIELEKNNPKIVATKEFKKLLKSRIEWIIWLRQNKKSDFSIFAIPVFSFMFVIGGFFYYFQDVIFLWNGEQINVSNIEQINEDNNIVSEIEEISELFIDDLNDVVETERIEKNTMLKIEKSEPINNELINTKISDFNEDDNEIELIEGLLFESLSEEENITDSIEMDIMIMEESELDFNKFCGNEWWELSWTWELEKCITKDKECIKSNFQNWICDFTEIE